MKKAFLFLTSIIFCNQLYASEIITIYSPYSPSHSGTPAMIKIIDESNSIQKKFKFRLEFKPGGDQIIAIRSMDEAPANSLSIVAPKYVEHISSGKLNRSRYVPVHALGDACWAVISNLGSESEGISSLKGIEEIVVGGVGFGNAAHLTALQIGEKYNFRVRYIPFKSNFDALILMAGNGSINFVLERVVNYENLKIKSSDLKMLAVSCPIRNNRYPQTRTLAEQGIIAPFVFNITVSSILMPESKRNEISKILDQATISIGKEQIQELSDMIPPIFSKISTQDHYNNSINLVEKLLIYHQKFINSSINR
jgi:tripartite-type tricarboxylate transporter receptor subunit TctC